MDHTSSMLTTFQSQLTKLLMSTNQQQHRPTLSTALSASADVQSPFVLPSVTSATSNLQPSGYPDTAATIACRLADSQQPAAALSAATSAEIATAARHTAMTGTPPAPFHTSAAGTPAAMHTATVGLPTDASHITAARMPAAAVRTAAGQMPNVAVHTATTCSTVHQRPFPRMQPDTGADINSGFAEEAALPSFAGLTGSVPNARWADIPCMHHATHTHAAHRICDC